MVYDSEKAGEKLAGWDATNWEPALSDCARFIDGTGESFSEAELKSRLILGNGASELIDLVTRLAAPAGGFQQGSSTVQYKEYERAALAAQPMKQPMKTKLDSSFSLM